MAIGRIIQGSLVLATAGLFFWFVQTQLPPESHWFHLHGALLILGFGGLALRLGPAPKAGFHEPLAVWMLSMVVLFVQSPMGHEGFIAALLGMLATQAIWAYIRYPECHKETANARLKLSLGSGVLRGMGFGVIFASAFSLIAAAIYVAARVGGAEMSNASDPSLANVIVSYFGGGIAAGMFIGLLWPLGRWPLGTMIIGIVGAMLVYGAIGLAMDGPQMTDALVRRAVELGLIVGPAAGLALRLQWSN